MTPTIKTLSFPFVLIACILATLIAAVGLVIVNIICMIRVILKVLGEVYNGR